MPRGWGKRVPVKFRCERDVLVEALAMAGRASTTRNALPVLSGVKLTLTGDPIEPERAYHFGLVNELCEPGEALELVEHRAAPVDRHRGEAQHRIAERARPVELDVGDDEGRTLGRCHDDSPLASDGRSSGRKP